MVVRLWPNHQLFNQAEKACLESTGASVDKRSIILLVAIHLSVTLMNVMATQRWLSSFLQVCGIFVTLERLRE